MFLLIILQMKNVFICLFVFIVHFFRTLVLIYNTKLLLKYLNILFSNLTVLIY